MATASDPNVLALQTAVSRFAGTVSGIGAVTTDGVMSDQLVANVQAALGYIAANDTAIDAGGNQVSADALALQPQVGSQAALQNAASGVATFLNQGADDLNLGGSNLNIVPAGVPGAAQANQLINAIAGMPTWAKVVGGIAALAVVGGVVHAVTKRRARRHYAFRDYGHFDRFADD